MDNEVQIPSFVNEGERVNNAANYVKNYERKQLRKLEFYKTLKKTIGVIAMTSGAMILVTQTPIKKPVSVVVNRMIEYDNDKFSEEFNAKAQEVEQMTGKTVSAINDSAKETTIVRMDGTKIEGSAEDYKTGYQNGYNDGNRKIDYSTKGNEAYDSGYADGYELGRSDREDFIQKQAEMDVERNNPMISGSIKEQYVNLQKSLLENAMTDNSLEQAKTR